MSRKKYDTTTIDNDIAFNDIVEIEEIVTDDVKDVIDDVDGYDGLVFNRWYADMCRTGVAIDWEAML